VIEPEREYRDILEKKLKAYKQDNVFAYDKEF
jgi:hypothetical protein